MPTHSCPRFLGIARLLGSKVCSFAHPIASSALPLTSHGQNAEAQQAVYPPAYAPMGAAGEYGQAEYGGEDPWKGDVTEFEDPSVRRGMCVCLLGGTGRRGRGCGLAFLRVRLCRVAAAVRERIMGVHVDMGVMYLPQT